MTTRIWHPFTQHGLGEPIPEIARAEGAVLYKTDGTPIIDAISSWWVQTHGHCHPDIVAAIQAQSAELDQMIFAGWTHGPAQHLAEGLGEFLPDSLDHIFFSDSGSTAVEVALKMALGFWHNQNIARRRILVMEHSYHGDTIGAMSIGARGVFNQAYAPLLFDVGTIPFPEASKEEDMAAALRAFCQDSDNPPAALIVEPLVLGAGGMKIYSPELLRQLHDICYEHDVLFIADEVMTGWGRTGTVFACEQAGISPDILCMAKGLTGGVIPLAVTAATKPIYDAHYSQDRSKMFFHSSSFTANPVACAAAGANLKIWREEPVQERIDAIIARHEAFAARLHNRSNISAVRQCGTILAFEIDDSSGDYMSSLGPELLRFFRERNVLLRPLGNTVYVMPPYCIRPEELDQVYSVIEEAIDHF
ncbi:adenosylmethionine-8-amino-7-oxononanoate aminotransferase [Parasphingorhabdus marina DSM 22363]|uniref:Adenosylmethionine-8-amino-7-oxononanoate aminotransferase n=1 Tax=Parasphingorhabdus marina DSM 22363 TaxID=1123272 RepID=A0A1N6CNF2_9SPHN|nr:adenosylmethionine--8-amino-7-oxononanoate transaminase [Parasphingorhabdus marina]SIN60110.1 adenosylmethionine-8-amino-7-oxononanoate aminotransferase [Parasphingorhabdus marina DSM 22363]